MPTEGKVCNQRRHGERKAGEKKGKKLRKGKRTEVYKLLSSRRTRTKENKTAIEC